MGAMIGLTMARSNAHMQMVLTMWNGVVVIGDSDNKSRSGAAVQESYLITECDSYSMLRS